MHDNTLQCGVCGPHRQTRSMVPVASWCRTGHMGRHAPDAPLIAPTRSQRLQPHPSRSGLGARLWTRSPRLWAPGLPSAPPGTCTVSCAPSTAAPSRFVDLAGRLAFSFTQTWTPSRAASRRELFRSHPAPGFGTAGRGVLCTCRPPTAPCTLVYSITLP